MATEEHGRTLKANQTLLHGATTGLICHTAYQVHCYFGRWFLEKVYENALAHRLRKAGLSVQQQRGLSVHDEDGTVVGEYFADLLVEDRVVVEVKASAALVSENTAQLLNYLKASRIQVGLLINFGGDRIEIRRFTI